MNKNAMAGISRLLGMKFWFGGKLVYPWTSPFNKVPNAAAITLDGCMTYKFRVHKNGKLRLMQGRKNRWLNLGLKPLQTVTLDELWTRIARNGNDYAGSFLQLTSPVPVPVDFAALREVEMTRRYANQVKI